MTTTIDINDEISFEEMPRCVECDGRIWDDNETLLDWELCINCVSFCYGCDEMAPYEEYQFCEYCDEAFCASCYLYEHSCQEENEDVHPYGYEPNFQFRKTGNETPIIENLFLGVELETQGNTYDIPTLTDFIGDESHAYMCEDGSVSGPEIITHPMTLDYHKNNFDWEALTDAADDDGLHSDSDAGLHVHVSRAALGDTLENQSQVGTNLLAVLETHFDMWSQLARRNSDQWAPKNLGTIDIKWGTPDNAKEAIETIGKASRTEGGKGKYAALNFQKQNTLEFRLFASTLDTDTIIATLEAVSLMVIIAKSFTLDQILTMSYDTVMTIATQHGFDSLIDWDKRNNIPVDAEALRKAFNAVSNYRADAILDNNHVDL